MKYFINYAEINLADENEDYELYTLSTWPSNLDFVCVQIFIVGISFIDLTHKYKCRKCVIYSKFSFPKVDFHTFLTCQIHCYLLSKNPWKSIHVYTIEFFQEILAGRQYIFFYNGGATEAFSANSTRCLLIWS